MQKTLIIIGVLCIVAGLAWPLLKHFPLGRLPGDISVGRENFRYYFQVNTCVVVSLVLTLIFWWLR